MAIIIGALTTSSFAGCVISANWGSSPNTQRLYCLGDHWVADSSRTFKRPTNTLSITCYAPGPSYSCLASSSCASAGQLSASVSPSSCGGGSGDPPGSSSWYVTSYSYNKDDSVLPGQESWSMMDYYGDNKPSFVLRGVAEGSWTANSGVSGDEEGTSSTGSVSAGGFGKSDKLSVGVVRNVGGGSSAKGVTGQASVSIPYTPLYI
jgi:hypothetical protein